jgi:hypothetical protein
MTPAEIAQTLAAMSRVEPFDKASYTGKFLAGLCVDDVPCAPISC